MIDALVAGKIHKQPQSRVASNGKRFCTTVLRASGRDGNGLFVSVIAFSQTACDALLALDEGDSVALAGELTPKIYTPRDGSEPRPSLDLVAHRVLSEYHVTRKRKAMADAKTAERSDAPREPESSEANQHEPPSGGEGEHEELDDAIPF